MPSSSKNNNTASALVIPNSKSNTRKTETNSANEHKKTADIKGLQKDKKYAEADVQTDLSLISISPRYSEILDSVFSSIQKDSSANNNTQNAVQKKAPHTLQVKNLLKKYACPKTEKVKRRVKESAKSSSESISENDSGISSKISVNSEYKIPKLFSDRKISKRVEKIKVKGKTLLVSRDLKLQTLPIKKDFIGHIDCQRIKTLAEPCDEFIRKYTPTIKNPRQYYFNYWVYFDGNTISERDQREITDSNIYLSEGNHICMLKTDNHTHEKQVFSPLKRTIELHIQPFLFTFVCAHCNQLISIVTNMLNHLRTHIKDLN